jgi:hypothetical protein
MHEATYAAWLTVKVWLAIVAVPFRAAPLFAATFRLTDPLPVPDAPEVMVIHEALLAAVHLHALVVDTFTVPVPPSTGTLSFRGSIE